MAFSKTTKTESHKYTYDVGSAAGTHRVEVQIGDPNTAYIAIRLAKPDDTGAQSLTGEEAYELGEALQAAALDYGFKPTKSALMEAKD